MATKSIILDDISEGIYMEWRKTREFFNFSEWIRSKMLEEYNKGQTNLASFERKVPDNFVCKHCRAIGQHWSPHCPHVSHGVEEE